MTLAPGTRLAHYEIGAKLGEGGMGEVYRATDTQLKRSVAIKVLPAAFSADPERLGRFEREAQLLAQLHHPNIASIFGLAEADGVRALVMELVEGQTLAERLTQGALALEDALAIARQIAEALETAHDKGIVHRDLKPQNIKAPVDGPVKVLDFGLAKAMASTGQSGVSATQLAQSPTLTQGATELGMILGTAAYMAPEQARGLAVDKRADIWAFGVVLHEMLTGRSLFAGPTVSDTLAGVLKTEIDLAALPTATPPAVRRLLRRCLERNPRNRLHDIADARLELAETEGTGASLAPSSSRAPRNRWLPLVAAVGLVAAVAGAAILGRRSAHTEPPTFRPLTFARGYVHSARFAPDQQTVIYGGAFEGRPLALFSTRIDSSESRPIDLPSTDIAGISRDGQMALLLGRRHQGSWLRVGTLAQVALAGGAPREILEDVYDADISPDGKRFAVVVVEGADQVLQYPIGRELFRTRGWIGQPRIAPDGERIAFADHRVWGDDLGKLKLAGADGTVVDLSPEAQYLHGLAWSPDGGAVWFSGATDLGSGTLWRVSPGGAPRVVLTAPTAVRVQDVSDDGHVLLLSDEPRTTLAGRLAGDTGERIYSWWDNDTAAAISRDGTIYAGHNPSVIVDGEYAVFFRRDGATPVQLGTGLTGGMTPDGRSVLTASLTGGRSTVTVRPVGAGRPRIIDLGEVTVQDTGARPFSFSSDGTRFAFIGAKPGAGRAAWVMDLGGGVSHVASPEGADSAVLSPDGSKVAVGDAARGLYVVPAAGGNPVPVTGASPQDSPLAWSADGREVLSWDRTLPARIYRTALQGGQRELVRELVPTDPAGILYGSLTLSPDGRYYLQRSRRVLSTVHFVTLH